MKASFKLFIGLVFCLLFKEVAAADDNTITPVDQSLSTHEAEAVPRDAKKAQKTIDALKYLMEKKESLRRLKERRVSSPISEQAGIKQQTINGLKDYFAQYEDLRINHIPTQRIHSTPQEHAIALKEFRSVLLDAIAHAKQQGIDPAQEPDLKKDLQRFLQGNSVSEFSGALEMQESGLSGKGVEILVLENGLTSGHKDLSFVQVASARIGDSKNGHGAHVLGIIHQIAPNAGLTVHNINIANAPAQELLRKIKLVNASFGAPENNGNGQTLGIFDYDTLIVQAAGNDAVDLDTPLYTEELLLRNLSEAQWEHILLIGNLSYGNVPHGSSNMPGATTQHQDHFIWTLGSDVLSASSDSGYARSSGTSMAAPVMTGNLALIAEKYSTLTPKDLQKCVLESADQDFYMTIPEWIPGWNLTIHIAPGNNSSVRFVGNNVQVEEPYDPAIWGRGILNLKRAFQYAELKSKGVESKAIKLELSQREQKANDLLLRYARQKRSPSLPSPSLPSPSLPSPSLPLATTHEGFWNMVLSEGTKTKSLEVPVAWIKRTKIKSLQNELMKEIRKREERYLQKDRDKLIVDHRENLFLIALNLKEYLWFIEHSALLNNYPKDILRNILKALIVDRNSNAISCMRALEKAVSENKDLLSSGEKLPLLELSVRVGIPEMVKTILEYGVRFNKESYAVGKKLCELAKKYQRVEVIKCLEEWKSMPNLFKAAEEGSGETLQDLLLKEPKNVDAKDKNGKPLLWIALNAGNLNTTKVLLDAGANTKLLSEDDLFNLMSNGCSPNCLRLLIDNLSLNSYRFGSLLHMAACANQVEIFILLVTEFSANLEERDYRGKIPLELMSSDNQTIVKQKLQEYSDFLEAVKKGNIETVRRLLKAININAYSCEALYIALNIDSAVDPVNSQILDLLIKNGANPNLLSQSTFMGIPASKSKEYARIILGSAIPLNAELSTILSLAAGKVEERTHANL